MRPIEKMFIHYRLYKPGSDKPLPRGGATICVVRRDDGFLWVGVTGCSVSDNYNRATGRGVAEAVSRGLHKGLCQTVRHGFNPVSDYRELDELAAKAYFKARRKLEMRTKFTLAKMHDLYKSDTQGALNLLSGKTPFRMGKELVDLSTLELRPDRRAVMV